MQLNNMRVFHFLLFLFLVSCGEKKEENHVTKNDMPVAPPPNEIEEFARAYPDNGLPSKSKGSVGNGSLENGKLMPWNGNNFMYFDTSSYYSEHAFVNDKVLKTVLSTYAEMEKLVPGRKFRIMECSNKEGGRIWPHRTHQNGLSIDFMSPLTKEGEICYEHDNCGRIHYLMDFDENGRFIKDTSVSIDFNTLALHLLTLNTEAKKNGLRINKVILKMELKDELYATENGKKLKNSGLYITQKLDRLINSLHDDHYHVDFDVIK
ncbi:MAG TPA: hypothetical protein VK177_00900 [Flavobacteriales bacterium]|nr:hypothetical protein [Flavobacteriales bacterium]